MNEKARVHLANALVLLVVVGLIFGALAARGGSGNDNGNAHDNMADAELIFTDEELTAKELKGQALTFIEPLLATAAGDDLSKLLEIKADISESLNAEYWLSDESVTNEEVFNSEKSAANNIRTLYNRESSSLDNDALLLAISRLIQADDGIAKLQIEQTENLLLQINDDATIAAISSYLNDARSSYEQAWHQIEQPHNYPNSIEHFKNSWSSSYNGMLKLDELTVPIVTIDSPPTNTYTNTASQTLAGTVWDVRLHTIPNVKVNVNDAAYEFSLDNGNYNGAIALSEGNNLITASATDAFNNAGGAGIEMVLDTISPEIIISGAEEGAFYNVDVAPTISIVDLHLAETNITLNGNSFASGSAISEEGEYSLTAHGKDLAGNESSKSISFVMDKTPPAVEITNPADNSYLRQSLQISGTAIDTYLDATSLEINGVVVSNTTSFDFDTTEYADGIYEIELSAKDKAGNEASRIISVTVDNTAPEIAISGVEEGAFYNYDVVPAVEITEANPDASAYALDNAPFELGSAILEEGMHEFSASATDKAGNNAGKSVKFGIDKTAPVTADNAQTGWVNSDTTVSLVAADVFSGVAHTYYKINKAGEWAEGTTILLSADGEYIISYYSTDVAGNAEVVKQTAEVQIDKTAPQIEIISPGQTDYSYTSSLNLSFSASDAHSGLKELSADIDGTAVNSGEDVNLYNYVLGKHILTINATDNVGNSASKTTEFNVIDDVAPESSAELSGTLGNNEWYASDIGITINAADAKSGVKKIQYSSDGTNYADYAAPLVISSEGATTVYYRAEDNSGNIEGTKSISFKLDKTGPITADNAPSGWHNQNVAINLTSSDGISGIAYTYYRINAGEWIEGTAIALSAEGSYTIDYYSVDNAGNAEDIKTAQNVVNIDKTSPVVSIESPADGSYIRQNIEINGSATDLHLDKLELFIDNSLVSDSASYAWNTPDYNDGLHEVVLRAYDLAGNAAEAKTSAIVDNTPPEINVTELNANPTLEDTNYSVIVELDADAELNMDFVQTSVDTSTGSTLGTAQFSEEISHDGYAALALSIIEGINEITFTATDKAGNSASKHLRRLVDKDKIPDNYETDALGTDSLLADTDKDGINDDIEDFDADGLTNLAEFLLGTDPFNPDTDADALTDFYEVIMSNTSPTNPDTRDAGIPDGQQDFDEDGLSNATEQQHGTHPFREDSDSDGISDGNEINQYGTDPLNPSTSGDGINDGEKIENGLNPLADYSTTQLTFEFADAESGTEVEIKATGKIIDANIRAEEKPYPLLQNLSGLSSNFIVISVDDNFDVGTIKVHYDPSKVSDPGKLRLFRFDPEQRIPIEAAVQGVDAANNIVWAQTNEFSLWFLADPSQWYANSEIEWNKPDVIFSSEEIMTVKARVRNNTAVPASNVGVDFYAGDPDSGGMLIGTDYVDVPGESYAFASAEWLPDKVSRIYVVIDSENLIPELNESDNKADKEFEEFIDSDGDGLADSEESNGMRLLFPYTPIYTDPFNPDTDNDGLTYAEEMGAPIDIGGSLYYNPVSLPDSNDSDNDNLDDFTESEGWYATIISELATLKEIMQKQENDEGYTDIMDSYQVTSDPMLYDTDNDNLSDEREMAFGSDPRNKDSDGDWIRDDKDDDPTTVETQAPKIEILGMTVTSLTLIGISAEVAYFADDDVKIQIVSLEKNDSTLTSHYSSGLYVDGYSLEGLELISSGLLGVHIKIHAKDIVGNEKIETILYNEGVLVSMYKFFEEKIEAAAAGTLGFGHGLVHGAAMEIGDTVEFVKNVVTEPLQTWEDAGKGIEALGQEGPGVILKAFGERMEPLRKEDNFYKSGTVEYDAFNAGWNTGFVTGYIATAVGEGILISKGAGAAASLAKSLAKTGQLANIASKIANAGKLVKTAGSVVMKNKLLTASLTIGTTYLLKEQFPNIDALDHLYYFELGIAPTFLTIGHGRNIRPSAVALSETEQTGLLQFAGTSMGRRYASVRVNFINKIDDITRKKFASLNQRFMNDILEATETHSLPNTRVTKLTNAAADLADVDGFSNTLRKARREISKVYETEGAIALKSEGKTIKAMAKNFDETVNGRRLIGEHDVLAEVDGKLVSYELKGWAWDELTIDFKANLGRQNNKLKLLKQAGNIEDYQFGFRVEPPIDIKTYLTSNNIPWRVV